MCVADVVVDEPVWSAEDAPAGRPETRLDHRHPGNPDADDQDVTLRRPNHRTGHGTIRAARRRLPRLHKRYEPPLSIIGSC